MYIVDMLLRTCLRCRQVVQVRDDDDYDDDYDVDDDDFDFI